MREGNNDIFLAGDDALGYLTRPMHKRYSMTFIWDHPFSTCGCYDQFFKHPTSPFVRTCTHLEYPHILRKWSHRFDLVDLIDLISSISSIWSRRSHRIWSFAIVSSYCFTSEIQKFMTHLNWLTGFLSQTPTTSWYHFLIQFLVACLGWSFH